MEGPSEAKMSCVDNKDGSCSVEYIPYEAGTYNLNVTYGGQPIKGPLRETNLLRSHQILLLKVSSWFCPCRESVHGARERHRGQHQGEVPGTRSGQRRQGKHPTGVHRGRLQSWSGPAAGPRSRPQR